MNNKTVVTIFVLAILALSSIAMIQILPVKASSSKTLTLSDAELMSTQFTKQWGDATLTGKTDVTGPGVQFNFTGLTSSDTGVGDNFPLDPLAGGTGTDNADFTAYSRYSMLFNNVGEDPVQVCLFMNTGFTTGHSSWDTYWASETVTVGISESVVVTLDFSSCYKIWGAEDDPVPEWQHPNGGGGWPVRRLDQVTNIGFQVYSGSDGSIVVSELTEPLLYLDPTHIQKAPGDIDSFFDVFVTLENFANLMGFDIKLTWDSTLITNSTAVDYTTSLDLLWPGGWALAKEESGAGFYKLAAASTSVSASNTGASDLFKVTFRVDKSCNFPLQTSIHFEVVKLSDDTEPTPEPIIATVTDGMYYMSTTTPDLEFVLVDPDLSKPFEICKTFEVEVWVTDICANLEDYDITILYDSALLEFVDVDYWGVLGDLGDNAHVELLAPGPVHVWDTGGQIFNSGDGLLFALTFHIEFDDDITHIWRKNNHDDLIAQVSFEDATLSFIEGTIPMSGILTPNSPLDITIILIRGDVDCDGDVDTFDISTIAYYYDASSPVKYDLTEDGIIDIFDIVTIATNFGYGM